MNEEIKEYARTDAYGVDAKAAVTSAKEVFSSGKCKYLEFRRTKT